MISDLLWRLESRHRAWRYRTRIDPAEIAWMRRALREGDVAVDAGAYKGGYTHWMRDAVGASGQVFAFEPQPELAAFLERTVRSFGWTNVRVEQGALSSQSGRSTLHVPGNKPSQRGSLEVERDDARRVDVRVATLDEFLEGQAPDAHIALIKCDVEGHELELFRGAERVLTTHRPALLFECEARFLASEDVAPVFEYLEGLGYLGSFFWHGDLLGVGDFEVATHQVEGRRPYANNFVFTAA